MGNVSPPPDQPYHPDTPESLADQVRLQEQALDRLLDWIRAADTKTSTIMAIDTGMLGIVIALLPASKSGDVTTLSWVGVGCFTLALSLTLCAVATFPRIKGPQNSLVYFEGIAARTPAEYARAVESRSSRDYLADLTAQCHRNAEIAATKYRNVQRSILCLLVGIGPWLAALFVLTRG